MDNEMTPMLFSTQTDPSTAFTEGMNYIDREEYDDSVDEYNRKNNPDSQGDQDDQDEKKEQAAQVAKMAL